MRAKVLGVQAKCVEIGAVNFRTYKNTDLRVSEAGFGLWTISTGWWGNFTAGEGSALGAGVGWLYEGGDGNRERDSTSLRQIHHMLEQSPGRALHGTAADVGKDAMFLIRVTHSSGMLEGKYTEETKFPPTAHRSHRPRSWLLNGIKKVEQLRFLENSQRTLGEAALQWLLADDRVASTLPNIYNEAQLVEFAKAPDTPLLTKDDMVRIDELYSENFGIEEEPPKFKGTMELPKETAAALTRISRS